MKLKVLPLDFWMDCPLCPPDDEMSWPREARKIKNPVSLIGKPGFYYDRITKRCWFERKDGTAYRYPHRYFLQELAYIEAREFDKPTINALRIIQKAGLTTRKQDALINNWNIANEAHVLYWKTALEMSKR